MMTEVLKGYFWFWREPAEKGLAVLRKRHITGVFAFPFANCTVPPNGNTPSNAHSLIPFDVADGCRFLLKSLTGTYLLALKGLTASADSLSVLIYPK